MTSQKRQNDSCQIVHNKRRQTCDEAGHFLLLLRENIVMYIWSLRNFPLATWDLVDGEKSDLWEGKALREVTTQGDRREKAVSRIGAREADGGSV